MTTAKLVTSPGEGHGLVDAINNRLYNALTHGKPVEPIVALVLLDPVGCGQRKTAKGRHQHVVYEATILEPVTDPAEATRLALQMHEMRDVRSDRSGQRTLPGNWPGMEDEEKRRQTVETLEDWADGNGLRVPAELEAMWRDYWEIGEGEESSFGNQGVLGDYRKAGWQQLLEFGYAREILKRDAPDETGDDADETGDETGELAAVPDPEPVGAQ